MGPEEDGDHWKMRHLQLRDQLVAAQDSSCSEPPLTLVPWAAGQQALAGRELWRSWSASLHRPGTWHKMCQSM